jgi:predicted nucleic acid-binding protein
VTLASLNAALGTAERILLDSSTLIAFHERLERAHPLARQLLERIANATDPLHGYCSVISASEILVRPIRASDAAYRAMYLFLTEYPNLNLIPVDLVISIEAATVRSMTGVRLPDALIVATGLLSNCEVIVSNDERWKRQFEPLFPQFRWLYLGDHLPA